MTAEQPQCLDGAQDALNRMKRAQERGTGCRLTAEMIASLYLTSIGQLWSEEDPRSILSQQQETKL